MRIPTFRETLAAVRRRPLRLEREAPVGPLVEARVAEILASLAGEPNGEALWETARRRVEDEVLRPLWLDGRLRGTKPEQAYFVRCDRTTMTEHDIDAGRLVVLAGVAPLRPAEFDIVRVEQTTAA